MQVTIDKNSGYCFGVEFAIKMAEDEMEDKEPLYCLGDIVHNDMEVKRLTEKGLVVIDREKLQELSNCKVLIRAHGEPPETYKLAIENNIELIDASCPVVLKLQHRVKNAFDKMERENGQIVIYLVYAWYAPSSIFSKVFFRPAMNNSSQGHIPFLYLHTNIFCIFMGAALKCRLNILLNFFFVNFRCDRNEVIHCADAF